MIPQELDNRVAGYARCFKLGLMGVNGVRDTDRAYQLRMEEVMEDLVRGFRIQPLRLSRDDRDGWVDKVLDAVPVHSCQLPLFGDHG